MKKVFFKTMKTIKFLAAALLLSTVGAGAQITLTKDTSTPRVGDVFNYHTINDGVDNLNVTHGGANQVWDMSAVEEGIMANMTYINASESTQPQTSSNLVCVGEQDGLTDISEVYYTASSTGFTVDKMLAPMMETSYTNRYFLKFPLSYNQEKYIEAFEGTIDIMGNIYPIAGTATIQADGYGTLKLPFATENNVLRIKVVYDYTYSADFGDGIFIPYAELHDVVYLWYNANTRHFIADYSLSYDVTGSEMELMTATLQYLSEDEIFTSHKNAAADNLSLYPNPTQGIVTISGTADTPDVKVYNLNGSLLKQEKSSTIDISDYATGVYLFDVSGEKYKVMKK